MALARASNIYYINDRLDKRTWTYIFGACCATTVFIPSFHNYRIWSFLGLGMTTYTAWYLAIAALINGQVSPQPDLHPIHRGERHPNNTRTATATLGPAFGLGVMLSTND